MNLPVYVLLFFALLGAVDKLLNNRFGLAEELDKGLTMMGSLALSMGGIYCFSIMLGELLSTRLGDALSALPFDPSLLISSVLAPDMGAFSIAQQLAADQYLLLFSGVALASTLGSTISFSLPVALSSVSGSSAQNLMSGMVYGIITVPFALLITGLMSGMPLGQLVGNLLPIAVLCGLLCLCIFRFKETTTRVFLFVGNTIRRLSVVLFVVICWQVCVGRGWAPVPMALINEILLIVFKITIIICGSFILSKLVLRYFMSSILAVAVRLRVNEFAMIGMILNLVTSVSMFSVFDQMDRRGQVMNSAFSVSAGFVLGGQLAFIAAVAPGAVPAFLVSKLAGGVLAAMLASMATKQEPAP